MTQQILELKSQAFDLIRQQEQMSQEMQRRGQFIAQLSQEIARLEAESQTASETTPENGEQKTPASDLVHHEPEAETRLP